MLSTFLVCGIQMLLQNHLIEPFFPASGAVVETDE